jgi:hypothetical protein
MMKNRYKNKHYGECDYCINDRSTLCDDCEHNEHEYDDHWEEATPEVIAARVKAAIELSLKKATDEYIEIDIPEVVKQNFDIAKKFADEQHVRPALRGVLMTNDGYMVSSDTHMLCYLRCDSIPEQLKGNVAITLENKKVGLNKTAPFPNYKPIVELTGHKSIPLIKIAMTYNDEIIDENGLETGFKTVRLQLENAIVALDDNKLQKAKDILEGEIACHYVPGEKLRPLIFEGSNGSVVVVPLRVHDEAAA